MSLIELNRLPATVKDIKTGSAIDRIRVQVGDFEIESLMAHQDVEKLRLRAGDQVVIVVKPTDVIVQRQPHGTSRHAAA